MRDKKKSMAHMA